MRFRDLSPRQLEVLKLTARGYSLKEAAKELSLGPDTIKQHRGAVLLKLQAHSMPHAVAIAMNEGILTRADLW